MGRDKAGLDGIAERFRRRQPPRLEELYSPRQVAEQLKLSRGSVRDLVRKGIQTKGIDGFWPVYRIGYRTIRIPATAVTAWLERHQLKEAAAV